VSKGVSAGVCTKESKKAVIQRCCTINYIVKENGDVGVESLLS
jgi:hypothetical protein